MQQEEPFKGLATDWRTTRLLELLGAAKKKKSLPISVLIISIEYSDSDLKVFIECTEKTCNIVGANHRLLLARNNCMN